MDDGFDISELIALEKEFTKMTEKYPSKAKSFLRKEGSKLRKEVVRVARVRTKKKTGRYHKSFKRGKPYQVDGEDTIRVYNKSSHAHLIEEGHVIKGKDGSEHGFKAGTHTLKDTAKDFEKTFINDAEDFLEDVVDKGGFY